MLRASDPMRSLSLETREETIWGGFVKGAQFWRMCPRSGWYRGNIRMYPHSAFWYWGTSLEATLFREVLHGVGADGVGVNFPIFAETKKEKKRKTKRSDEKKKEKKEKIPPTPSRTSQLLRTPYLKEALHAQNFLAFVLKLVVVIIDVLVIALDKVCL